MAKTIVGELKDLFVKFGGDAGDLTGKETTAEMIDAIEKVYEDKGDTLPAVTTDDNGKVLSVVGGEWDKADAPAELPAVTSDDNGKVLGVANGAWGKADIPAELPAVTTDDNGKVLAVANGAWGKADAPSGSNDFVVTFSGSDNSITCDKSVTEIVEAYNAGKTLKGKRVININQTLYLANSYVNTATATKIILFEVTSIDVTTEKIYHYIIMAMINEGSDIFSLTKKEVTTS